MCWNGLALEGRLRPFLGRFEASLVTLILPEIDKSVLEVIAGACDCGRRAAQLVGRALSGGARVTRGLRPAPPVASAFLGVVEHVLLRVKPAVIPVELLYLQVLALKFPLKRKDKLLITGHVLAERRLLREVGTQLCGGPTPAPVLVPLQVPNEPLIRLHGVLLVGLLTPELLPRTV